MNDYFSPLRSIFHAFVSSLLSAYLIVTPANLYALPSGMDVKHGQMTVGQHNNMLHIQQLTPQAIANWESFSIGMGQTVNIDQLSVDSVLLNRVTGAQPSELLGQLNANGRVYLINPNGILVGRDASINTAEFLASALDISDSDFLNGGDMLFSGDSMQSVVNLGSITADNGDVILLAYTVANEGDIQAPGGVAALGAGNQIVLTHEGNQRILVKTDLSVPPGAEGVANSGIIEAAQAELKAAGGNVYELAINQSGIVQATGLQTIDGRVLITAESGNVLHSGTASALNADGSGGEVLIGGDYRGENPEIPNAANTVVTEDARIDVSAQAAQADGGRAIVWADNGTRFLGRIDGQGGAEGGDGAFAEVSGKAFLDFQGTADLQAPKGEAGQLLLDPDSLTVQAVGTETNITTTSGDPFFFAHDDVDLPSILLTSTLQAQLALSDVILDTSTVRDFLDANGSITIADPVSWTSGNQLTFRAGNDININADLAGGTADIVFGLGINDGFVTSGNLNVDTAATITADRLTIQKNPTALVVFSNGPTEGPLGEIDINGVLNVDTLEIILPPEGMFFPGGISGNVRIDNTNNQIAQLTIPTSPEGIFGDFNVVDSAGGLTISGDFDRIGGGVTISTVGDLTLEAGTVIALVSSGDDIVLAAQSGSFINNAGASAVAPDTGRFLIYSDAPANTTLGGLSADPVYNKTFSGNAPSTITQSGNRFLYSLAPKLTYTATGFTRDYGSGNPTLTFSISGLVGDDALVDVLSSGTPNLSTALTANTPAGFYEDAVTVSQGSVVLSDYDYQFEGLAGDVTIDKVILEVLAASFSREYGDANPTFTGGVTGFVLGEDASVLTALPTYATMATQTSNVGEYEITASGAAATNYDFNYTSGLLTIDKADLTWPDPRKLYHCA